jgi:hypothetical protein
MAYSILQSPADTSGVKFVGALDDIIYVVNDTTNTSELKYKYICTVTIGGIERAKLKVSPNGVNAGIFNVAAIIRDYLDPALTDGGDSIHKVMTEANTTMYKAVTLAFGYEYAASVDEQPTEYLNQASSTLYALRATFVPNYRSFDDKVVSDYVPSTTAKFLTSLPNEQYVTEDDWGVVAMITDFSITQRAMYMRVRYYNESTLLSDSMLPFNQEWLGTSKFGYFGAYPENLEAQVADADAKPSANAGWTYYTVEAKLSNLTSSTSMSQVYTFYNLQECKYDVYRLAWLNEYGGWDYLNFPKASERSVDVKREMYLKDSSNWMTAGTASNYARQPWNLGEVAYGVESRDTLTLNSMFLDEAYNDAFKSLMQSREVYVQQDNWLPVQVRSSQFVYKTGLNGQMVQFSISIQLRKNVVQ